MRFVSECVAFTLDSFDTDWSFTLGTLHTQIETLVRRCAVHRIQYNAVMCAANAYIIIIIIYRFVVQAHIVHFTLDVCNNAYMYAVCKLILRHTSRHKKTKSFNRNNQPKRTHLSTQFWSLPKWTPPGFDWDIKYLPWNIIRYYYNRGYPLLTFILMPLVQIQIFWSEKKVQTTKF